MNYDEGVPLWRFAVFMLGMAIFCSLVGAMVRYALDAQRIEARSAETLQAARPEGQEPDGEADAPSPIPLVGEQ